MSETMKKFEKWWEEQCKNNIGRMFESPREFAEKGWQAALEWIREEEALGWSQAIEEELND